VTSVRAASISFFCGAMSFWLPDVALFVAFDRSDSAWRWVSMTIACPTMALLFCSWIFRRRAGTDGTVISVVSVTGNLDACALVHDCGALPCPWLSAGIDHWRTQISGDYNVVSNLDSSSVRHARQWIWLGINYHRPAHFSYPERIPPLANSASTGVLAQGSFHMMTVHCEL